MDGAALILVFLLGIVAIILLTAKLKLHAFLSIFLVTTVMGLAFQLPPTELVKLMLQGFGNVLGYIAIITLSACIIGEVLDKTGATLTFSNSILRIVGRSRSPLAVGLAGYLLAVPLICCDTAFIMLSPVARSLAGGSGFPLSLLAMALAVGAYTSFKLVFPACPLFPATIFGADFGKVLVLGLLTSIPTFIVGMLWAYRGRSELNGGQIGEQSYEELRKKYAKLPSALASYAVILTPIALICIKSLLDGVRPESDMARVIFDFLGHPIIALPIGVALSLRLARGASMKEVNGWVSEGIGRAASILAIVGAGGALGSVLQGVGIGTYLGKAIVSVGVPGVLVIFLVAAAIKTGQGSSMVTMVTAPSIILPILPSLAVSPVLASLAVCAGAMISVHANDSYFWVVTGFSKIDVPTGYRRLTAVTVIQGLVAIAAVILLGALLG